MINGGGLLHMKCMTYLSERSTAQQAMFAIATVITVHGVHRSLVYFPSCPRAA